MFYFLKTTVRQQVLPSSRKQHCLPSSSSSWRSSPAVPGSEDEVGACLRDVPCYVCFKESEKRKFLI